MLPRIWTILVLAFVIPSMAAVYIPIVNFPYPQNSTYGGHGICVQSPTTDLLKSRFTDWLANYYVAQGPEARIKFDDPTYTVSAGIGYGMLMMVYMSDNITSYESQFNKLWAYYKARRNNSGLMN
jgi:hypothetical protein